MTQNATKNDEIAIRLKPETVKDDDGVALTGATVTYESDNPAVFPITDNGDGTAVGFCGEQGDAKVTARITAEGAQDGVNVVAEDVHVGTGQPFSAEFESTLTPHASPPA